MGMGWRCETIVKELHHHEQFHNQKVPYTKERVRGSQETAMVHSGLGVYGRESLSWLKIPKQMEVYRG